jgi:GntR family transcriptional regulator, transcriptional repressor for pyruvate dehydrogenase complex
MQQRAGDGRTTKASFAIAADFRSRIARGELAEGELLPVESDLVDELGVSKGVVREALRILEIEGLVEVRRGLGGGPRVRHPSIPQVANGMGVYLQIGDVLVTDVWESRDRVIGGAIERLAAQPGGGASPDLAELAAGVTALAEVVGDFEAFYPLLLDVGEMAVLAAGSATEHVIVRSLRHVIAAELAAATGAIVDVGEALAAERAVTSSWSETLRHVRAHHPHAARRAYQRQADLVRVGLWDQMKDVTVGEAVGAPAALLRTR